MFETITPILNHSHQAHQSRIVVKGHSDSGISYLTNLAIKISNKSKEPSSSLLVVRSSLNAANLAKATTPVAAPLNKSPVWVCTLGQLGFRLLSIYGSAVGLKAGFTVMDRDEKLKLLLDAQRELRFENYSEICPQPNTLLQIYGRIIQEQSNLATVMSDAFTEQDQNKLQIAKVFTWYTNKKRKANLLDSEDLLIYLKLLLKSPVGEAIKCLYENILVDGYEDISKLEHDLINLICERNTNLFVTGDPTKAIFSYRGGNIKHFSEMCEGKHNTKVIDTNSTIDLTKQTRLVNKLTAIATQDERSQSKYVVQAIVNATKRGVPLKDQAVLYRSRYLGDDLETQLIRNHIPFSKQGGALYDELDHIKDLLSMMRIIENPKDTVAWGHLLTAIGLTDETEKENFFQQIRLAKGNDVLRRFTNGIGQLSGDSGNKLNAIRETVTKCLHLKMSLADETKELTDLCEKFLVFRFENATARLTNLKVVCKQTQNRASNRGEFITQLSLESPEHPGQRSDNYQPSDQLTLSTIHSAKGLRWKSVYLIHCSEENFKRREPQIDGLNSEPNTEKNLINVALETASDELTLSYPIQSNTASPSQNVLTPHLKDLAHLFEKQPSATLNKAPGNNTGLEELQTEVSIEQALMELWN